MRILPSSAAEFSFYLSEAKSLSRLCRLLIRRDGSLLPKYQRGKFSLNALNDNVTIDRPLEEPECFAYDTLKRLDDLDPKESILILTGVESGSETRYLALFETSELLIADHDGGFSVHRLREPGVSNFAKCTHQDFWSKVNPYLDHPIVEPLESGFSRLRFSGISDVASFERFLIPVRQVLATDADEEIEILITCATRESQASASVKFSDTATVSDGMREFANELVSRIVATFKPFSEGLRSADEDVGAWVPRDEAVWVAPVLGFSGSRHSDQLTAIERTKLVGQLRHDLLQAGVPCADLFDLGLS